MAFYFSLKFWLRTYDKYKKRFGDHISEGCVLWFVWYPNWDFEKGPRKITRSANKFTFVFTFHNWLSVHSQVMIIIIVIWCSTIIIIKSFHSLLCGCVGILAFVLLLLRSLEKTSCSILEKFFLVVCWKKSIFFFEFKKSQYIMKVGILLMLFYLQGLGGVSSVSSLVLIFFFIKKGDIFSLAFHPVIGACHHQHGQS